MPLSARILFAVVKSLGFRFLRGVLRLGGKEVRAASARLPVGLLQR